MAWAYELGFVSVAAFLFFNRIVCGLKPKNDQKSKKVDSSMHTLSVKSIMCWAVLFPICIKYAYTYLSCTDFVVIETQHFWWKFHPISHPYPCANIVLTSLSSSSSALCFVDTNRCNMCMCYLATALLPGLWNMKQHSKGTSTFVAFRPKWPIQKAENWFFTGIDQWPIVVVIQQRYEKSNAISSMRWKRKPQQTQIVL